MPTEDSFILFEALGRRLEKIRISSPGNMDQALTAFLCACARINLSLGNIVTWPALTKANVIQLLQVATKMEKDLWNDEVTAVTAKVHAHLADNPSAASLGQLVFSLIAAFPRYPDVCRKLFDVASRKKLSLELMSQLAVLRLVFRLYAPEFLEEAACNRRSSMQLPNKSSQQHYQVSGTLTELGLDHDMEVPLDPYVVDIRVRETGAIIEIDGPMHFLLHREEDSIEYRYDFKTKLKHRLLTQQGHKVYHIPYHHWPQLRNERLIFLKELLYKDEAPLEL